MFFLINNKQKLKIKLLGIVVCFVAKYNVAFSTEKKNKQKQV